MSRDELINLVVNAYEKWLFDNEIALGKVKQGLKDSKEGNLCDKGSFAKYVDDRDEYVPFVPEDYLDDETK